MQYWMLGSTIFVLLIVAYFIGRAANKDRRDQKDLDTYLSRQFTNEELGLFYERYIGHLYETEGYQVQYFGATEGYADLGRDLIVRSDNEVFVIQAKYWARSKTIHEKHIFQLYGTTAYYHATSKKQSEVATPVFYTSARYSEVAKNVGSALGVVLKNQSLDWSYPMIKCCVLENGQKIYLLPFHPDYDRVRIDLHRDEFFVKRVKDATAKGFRRAG